MLLKSLLSFTSFRFLRLLVSFLAAAVYIRFRWRRRLKWAYDQIPLPALEDYSDSCKKNPLWYIAGGFALPPEEQLEIFQRMGKPDYVKGRVFFMPIVASTNKADITIASTKRKPIAADAYKPFVGPRGIVFQEGEKARRERHMLNRGFTQHIYREMYPSMVHTAQRMLDRMLEASNSPPGHFDVESLISRAALESVAEAGFGLDIHKDKDLPKQRALKQMLLIPDNPICMFPLGGQLIEWWNRSTIDLVYEMIDEAISKRLQQYKVEGRIPGQFEYVRDLLDVVISSSVDEKGNLDFTMMRDQTKLLFIAGSDTTSRTMHWALVMLAAYPEVQDKVREELIRVNREESVPFDRLAKLPYMDAFFREVLRLYAPLTNLGRRLDEGETDFRGIPIPDTELSVITYHSLMAQQRDDYFPLPKEFKPERWLDSSDADRGAFGTFSNGLRICLGRNFALTTMKTWLVVILEKHRVESLSQNQVLPRLGAVGQLAAPVGAYPLRLKHE